MDDSDQMVGKHGSRCRSASDARTVGSLDLNCSISSALTKTVKLYTLTIKASVNTAKRERIL